MPTVDRKSPTLIKQSLQKRINTSANNCILGELDADQFVQWQKSSSVPRLRRSTAWLKEARHESLRIALNTVAGLHQIKLHKNKKLFILIQRIGA